MKSKLEALEREIWADRKHRRIKKIKAAFSAYTEFGRCRGGKNVGSGKKADETILEAERK